MVDLALASAGFAAITIVFGWIFEIVTRYVLKIETSGPSWTLGKWIITAIILIVWIAIGNFLMVNLLFEWRAMSYFSLLRMIGYTALIGVFPVVLSGIIIQLRASKKNEESATDLSKHLHPEKHVSAQTVKLDGENGSSISLQVADVRYMEAMQNYVNVFHVADAQLQKTVLRTTVASIAKQFEGTDVIRCHRSFLVNVDHIEKVEGNAQGLRLQLKDIDEAIVPVSRPYISTLRALLG